MLKKNIFIVLLLLFWVRTQAQVDNSVFQILNLPFSSHAAALGGENISIIEDDLTMAVHNPALLSCVADKTLNLNYTLYIAGVNAASAAFSRVLGDRSTWAVTAQFVNYGTMKETTSENIITGTFSAKDMAFSGIYSYDLSDYWSGGVKANLIYSNYDKFSSFAIGVDLGLNYYHQNSDFSFSLVARNLGGQIVAFEDKHDYGIFSCIRTLGNIYRVRGNEALAAEYYQEALVYMQEHLPEQDPTTLYQALIRD